MGILAACDRDLYSILSSYQDFTSHKVASTQDLYAFPGGGEAQYVPPAQKNSYIPHLRIFSIGTASLVSSIGLTIISLIAKLVNKGAYENWFQEEKEELKKAFILLGHVTMMCIRPESASKGLEKFLNAARGINFQGCDV